ncbi:helix-turn-helix domain-containing protein [Roseixanthobacter liquoris]|uniref:helix-turn-helix domain-containing protein n=1 Tax=Roseixanthobacter liquoris TaxID=3119921 RepID=UPI00372896F4
MSSIGKTAGRDDENSAAGEAGGLAHAEEDRRIGSRIRILRKERKLSIERLSEESGLSVGMLSQLERGLTTPSVRSLRVLGAALDVPISWFFTPTHSDDPAESGYIVRRGSRGALTLTPSGIYKELLTPEGPGLIELYELSVKPGGTSGSEFYSHRGEKAGVVIAGTLRLWLDNEPHILNEGDSFRFPSEIAHRFENQGGGSARVIWVVASVKNEPQT